MLPFGFHQMINFLYDDFCLIKVNGRVEDRLVEGCLFQCQEVQEASLTQEVDLDSVLRRH